MPAKPPTPPSTSGPWVRETADFISSTARSPASVSTPDWAYADVFSLTPQAYLDSWGRIPPREWGKNLLNSRIHLLYSPLGHKPGARGHTIEIMCGIVGIVSSEPVNQQIYDSLLLLQHRGQDST